MYCPKCGAQNAEDVKYCRVCGVNLSLVPKALSGELPQDDLPFHERRKLRRQAYEEYRKQRRQRHEPNFALGIQQVSLGFGFLIVAFSSFFFAPAGRNWWFWMLIPAFALLGKGFASIVAAKQVHQSTTGATQPIAPPARTTGELEPNNHNQIPQPPPSVTENTTRHLDATKEQRPRETR